MRMHGSILRGLILGALSGAKDYYEIAELQLTAAREADIERIMAEVKKLGLDAESEYNEWCLEKQSHDATHQMLVPNFFRYSFLVLLYLIIENKLKELCVAAKAVKSLSTSVPHVQTGIVHAYERYLSVEVKIHGINWDSVHGLNKIRNCIVHDSGCVDKSRGEADLREIARLVPGITISGRGDAWTEDLQPLYLNDHMLVIEPQYCRQVTTDVKELFTAICDAIPLPKLTFSS